MHTYDFKILRRAFCIITLGALLSCSPDHMKIGGSESVTLSYKGGNLSVSIFKHGAFWRIANQLSSKDVTVHCSKLHVIINGNPVYFNIFDEYGKMIPYNEEKLVKNKLIYYEIMPNGYKVGNKVELAIDADYIDGINAASWLITER